MSMVGVHTSNAQVGKYSKIQVNCDQCVFLHMVWSHLLQWERDGDASPQMEAQCACHQCLSPFVPSPMSIAVCLLKLFGEE